MTEPMIRLKVNFVAEEQLAYMTIVQGEGAGAEDLAHVGLGAEGFDGRYQHSRRRAGAIRPEIPR